jgi:uncharacterized membrane protein YfcA
MSASAIMLVLAVITLISGVLIGCIGIGGVILVPALTYIGGIDVQVSIASSMLAYLFTGLVSATLYARRGSIRWSMTGWLCGGAIPGAFLGAALVAVAPARVLELLIAALTAFAGINALTVRPETSRTRGSLGNGALAAIGVLTGLGSALTGTGGPVILVPILVWLRLPVLMAVGLSQIIQVPIGALATIGNVTYGRVNVLLGLGMAVMLMIGATFGASIAHSISSQLLRRVVAVVLVCVGIMIVTRIGFQTLLAGAP